MNTIEFELLVREHEPMVRSLIYHIMRNPNDVDDISQEVFIKAYQSMESFRGGSFRAYLGRIARNHCYDELRRRRARNGMTFVELVPDDWPTMEETPEDIVVSRAMVEEVTAILDGMDKIDKEIMLLRHMHQFSYDEISAVVGMKPGAIRTRISRSRQRVIEEVMRRERHESSNLG